MSLPLCSDPSACQAHHYQSYFFVVTLSHGPLHSFFVTNSVIPVSIREAIPTVQSHSHPSTDSTNTTTYPSSVEKLRYQSTIATTKQLLWVLRLSLLLNLIPFSMGLQINSLDPSHQRCLCPSGFGDYSHYVSSIPGRGALATVDSDWTPTCLLVSGLSIEGCDPNLPLIATGLPHVYWSRASLSRDVTLICPLYRPPNSSKQVGNAYTHDGSITHA